MKTLGLGLLSAVLLTALPSDAQVVQGRINEVLDDTSQRIGSTIDNWFFTVNSPGIITIDTLSWERDDDDLADGDDDFSDTFDINGDGEIAFIDPYIYLFNDDGDLTLDDFIDENDDDFENTFDDGSIYGYDSYLEIDLPAGDYVLAVGSFSLDAEEAVAGLNDETDYPASTDEFGDLIEIPSAPYQITWDGDLTITRGPFIPEPGSAMLLAIAVGCLVARRR